MKDVRYDFPFGHSYYAVADTVYPPFVPTVKHRYTPLSYLIREAADGNWWEVRQGPKELEAYRFPWMPEKTYAVPWGEAEVRKSQEASDADKFSDMDMSGLPASEFLGVELKVNKETFPQRSRTMATKLGVDSKKLQSRVQGFLYKVPRGANSQSLRDELEQAIWLQLTHWYNRTGKDISESGQRNALVLSVKGEVASAYNRWYTRYADERQLGTNAELRAIALDRAYDRNRQQGLTFAEELQAEAEGTPTGLDSLDQIQDEDQEQFQTLADKDWVDLAELVNSELSILKLLNSMPERIKRITIQKINGYAIIRRDRTYFDKWMKTNRGRCLEAFKDGGGTLTGSGWNISAR